MAFTIFVSMRSPIKFSFFIFLFVFLSSSAQGQLDSLKLELKKAQVDSSIVDLNLLIGWELVHTQHPQEALEFVIQAENLVLKMDDVVRAESVYRLKAFCYGDLNDRPNCLNSHLKRVKLLEAHMDSSRNLARAYYEIAAVLHSQKQTDFAETYFLKCKSLAKAIGYNTVYGVVHIPLAQIKVLRDDFSGAKIDLREAYRVSKDSTPSYAAYAYSELANVYLNDDSLDIAQAYADTAFAILGPDANGEIAGFLFQALGRINHKKGDNAIAVEYLNKARVIWEGDGSLFYLQDLYLDLAKAYSNVNASLANAYFIKHIELRDEANSSDNNEKIAEMEVRFQSEKKEQEIKLLSKEKEISALARKQQEKVVLLVSVGSGLLFIFALFLISRIRLIRKQNVMINAQKTEVLVQKDIIEEKSKELGDSINYAMRIQTAALTDIKAIQQDFKESFVIYKAKDKLSGDFYWKGNFKNINKEEINLIALGDCTGHGVPGALLSILGINYLNVGLTAKQLGSPAKALDFLNNGIHETFSSSEGEIRDGMDMAVIAINKQEMTMEYACAKNPVYVIRNGELIVLKGDKHPIGKDGTSVGIIPFTNKSYKIEKGDSVYLFSDGFADQFGGEKGKKFGYKSFKSLLLSLNNEAMTDQKSELEDTFDKWQGNLEQLDDVCVIGVRV